MNLKAESISARGVFTTAYESLICVTRAGEVALVDSESLAQRSSWAFPPSTAFHVPAVLQAVAQRRARRKSKHSDGAAAAAAAASPAAAKGRRSLDASAAHDTSAVVLAENGSVREESSGAAAHAPAAATTFANAASIQAPALGTLASMEKNRFQYKK